MLPNGNIRPERVKYFFSDPARVGDCYLRQYLKKANHIGQTTFQVNISILSKLL